MNPLLNRSLMLVSGLSMFSAVHLSVWANAPLAEDLRQTPFVMSVKTAPNVVLMMDDSQSMMSESLPAPPSIDWSNYNHFPAPFYGPDNSGGTTYLEAWLFWHINPIFNPLFYNPAIVYQPWNDNNKPLASNFGPSRIGTISGTDVIDQTRNDMRFRMEAGVKVEVNTSVTDLFRRYGTRQGPNCLKREFVESTRCTSWGPQIVDPNSEDGVRRDCLTKETINVEVCTQYDSVPNFIQGKYLRFEGSTPAQITDKTNYRLVEIDRDVPNRMYPTPIDPYTGTQIDRPDCANPKNCTFTEEAQNYANWWTYYRTRLNAAIAVTSQVMADVDEKIRVGFGRLNYFADGAEMWSGVPSSKPPATLPMLDGQPNPGHIVRGVRPFTIGSADRQELFTWLFGLNGVGGTPIREAMDAVGKYYRRADVRGPWADAPGIGDPSASTQLACRRNFLITATDGSWTDSPNHPRMSVLYPALPAGTPANSDANVGPTNVGTGSQVGRSYQYDPSAEPVFGVSSSKPETLTDVALHYWQTDLRSDLANVNRPTTWPNSAGVQYPKDYANPATWQSMTNFVVGYGLQPSVNINDAKAAMQAGTAFTWPNVNVGDTNDNAKVDDAMRAALISRGDFYTAQSPAALAAALRKVFAQLGATQGSSSALAVSSNVITKSDDYVFEASYDTASWAGSLRAVSALDLLAEKPKTVWLANFPADFKARNLITTKSINSPVAMRWNLLTPAQQVSIGSEKTFDYLIGDRAGEAPVGTLRQRASLLGSIINASPLFSGSTHYGYQAQAGLAGASYAAYLKFKRDTRSKAVLVGSNSGMLHGFDAKTGAELFGFTPRAALGEMKKLASSAYQHQYLVDGLITEGDAYVGGQWRTFALGSGGAGPKSLFLLDITNPGAISSSSVKWDLDATNETGLGHILGGGIIAPVSNGKWVVIVGNGYESQTHEASLLIFDLETGNLIRKINTGVGKVSPKNLRNGLGTATPLYDGARNVIGVFAGDKLGNMWRFDLSSKNSSEWKITTAKGALTAPIFTATDDLGAPQPISAAPRVTVHPEGGLYIVFGTGKAFEINDPLDRQVQTVYAIRDQSNNGPFLKTALKKLTLQNESSDLRSLQGATGPTGIDWASHKGWYFNLSTDGTGGERIVASPRLNSGMVNMTSFHPENADQCESGGRSFVYNLDLANGFTRAAFLNKGPEIVGVRAAEGVISSATSLFSPANTNVTPTNSMTLAQLQASIKDTRYSITGGVFSDTSAASSCRLAANSVNNNSVVIPTTCAGTTPLRVWRDLR